MSHREEPAEQASPASVLLCSRLTCCLLDDAGDAHGISTVMDVKLVALLKSLSPFRGITWAPGEQATAAKLALTQLAAGIGCGHVRIPVQV